MEDEDAETGRLLRARLLGCGLYVFFKLPYSVLKCRSGIIHFVHDQNALANQTGHFEGGKVKPLSASDFGTGRFDWIGWIRGWQLLIERKTDSLNGNVGSRRPLKEGSVPL